MSTKEPIVQTETEIRSVIQTPLFFPNEPDRNRLSQEFEGKKDRRVIIKVFLADETD